MNKLEKTQQTEGKEPEKRHKKHLDIETQLHI